MSWAKEHVSKLLTGETVKFRAGGPSMKGRIEPGQLCTVEPAKGKKLQIDDIVLCRVPSGNFHLHLIKSIRSRFLLGKQFLIGNNFGDLDGWVKPDAIFGKCIKVESAPDAETTSGA